VPLSKNKIVPEEGKRLANLGSSWQQTKNTHVRFKEVILCKNKKERRGKGGKSRGREREGKKEEQKPLNKAMKHEA